MLEVKFYEAGAIDDSLLFFAVIVSKHQDKWVFCKHKDRDTWEIPGGRRETGETILAAAKRELFEETGAKQFEITPVCIYSVKQNDESFGMLYYANILEFDRLPETEIEKIDMFRDMPSKLTYPLIQPKLMNKVKEVIRTV